MQLTKNDYAKYQATSPDLADAVVETNGDPIMKRDPKTDYCVKFEGGLCGIQQKYGEDFLGEACYFYPRVTRTLGDNIFVTAALSCPEIARLSLFDDNAFNLTTLESTRLPESMKNYLPKDVNAEQAFAMHQMFIEQALNKAVPAERSLMRMLVVSESLERISTPAWGEAIPFYFSHADAGLPAPEGMNTDPFFLLQALCGLVVAAKKVHNFRLMQTVNEMQRALHITIRMDNLAITPLPDSFHVLATMQKDWQERYAPLMADVLRRYLAMQVSLAMFPFYGFGGSLAERMAIIGVRFATVKLALMCVSSLKGKPLDEPEIIRVIQSISRFLDHLAETEFSLKIYQETGWLKKARLRALLSDF